MHLNNYQTILRDSFALNFNATSRNYAFDRVVHAVTNADLTSNNPFRRMTFSIESETAYIGHSAVIVAPTSTNDDGRDRDVDAFTIDGRSFNSLSDPDTIDIVLENTLIIVKENRTDGQYNNDFNLINLQERSANPVELDAVRVWTRNCIVVSDVPKLSVLKNSSDTVVEFLTFDGEPGFDVWMYTPATSPGSGGTPQIRFTDGFGATISRSAFEEVHGPLPQWETDPGIQIPGAILPPSFPLSVSQGAHVRSVVGNGPAPEPGVFGLASGMHPDQAMASLDPEPRYGPFGFGRTLEFSLYCSVDVNGDSVIDLEDLYEVTQNPVDINRDGMADIEDAKCLERWLRRSEVGDMRYRMRE